MRNVLRFLKRLLPTLPPGFFFCCTRFCCCCCHYPQLLEQTQDLENRSWTISGLYGHQKQAQQNPCWTITYLHTRNGLFSIGELCQNPSFIQGNDHDSKRPIRQACANPRYGGLDKLDGQETACTDFPEKVSFPKNQNRYHELRYGKPSPVSGYRAYYHLSSYGLSHGREEAFRRSQKSFNGHQEQSVSTLAHESTHTFSAKRILEGLGRMQNQVDPSTYCSLLQFCCISKSLKDGKFVHDHIISHGLEHYGCIEALLLEMYCKCEALEDALCLFSRMQIPCDAPAWNVLFRTLKEQEQHEAVVELFKHMQVKGVLPDKVTYISLTSVCAAFADPHNGVIIHACIAFSEFASDIILETAIINMYAKCGRMADARRLFDRMPDKNVITWTTFITAHAQQHEEKESLQLFDQMHQECQVPNRVTYVNTLSACAGLEDLAHGRRVHALMIYSEEDSDVVVRTAVANMYGKCGSSKDALNVLHEHLERNEIMWNAIIAALVHCSQGKEAIVHFLQMEQEGILPDRITLMSIVEACASLAAVKQGKWIHACIVGSDAHFDARLGNALINMYDKCGKLGDARHVFEGMPDKNLVSWNTIITAYVQNKHGKYACWLFDQMQHEGILADKVTLYAYLDACCLEKSLAQGTRVHACLLGNSLITLDASLVTATIAMYGKCGSLKYAQETSDRFLQLNGVIWNALIAAYARHGEERRALQLFDQLLWEGMIPSEGTFVGLLNAFTAPACLAAGKRVHTIINGCGYMGDNILGNALINMYSKCGSLACARAVFDTLSDRDAISWTTVIGVYGDHGQGRVALELFDQMLQLIVPDEVTFLNVLTACNRSGLVEQGRRWFNAMSKDYGITPRGDHYSCMVDLFGRAGQLDEAKSLMKGMPFEPTYTAWIAFLGACRYTLDVESAEFIAQHLLATCPENHQLYVLLSNIYAAAGRRDDAAGVMSIMRRTGHLLDLTKF